MQKSLRTSFCLSVIALVSLGFGSTAHAGAFAGGAQPRPLITQKIDASNLVMLPGSVRAEANQKFDRGAVANDFRLEHMMLVLERSAEQDAALKQLVDQVHTSGSPMYHQWMTAEEYGSTFGAGDSDLAKIEAWLQQYGFQINDVRPNRLAIDFSGTAAQVRAAFHTEIHELDVYGESHFANMTSPKIPAALQPRVAGITALDNFQPKNTFTNSAAKAADAQRKAEVLGKVTGKPIKAPEPDATLVGSGVGVTPIDYWGTYSETSVLTSYTGTGHVVAVAEDSTAATGGFDFFRNNLLGTYGATSLALDVVNGYGADSCNAPGRTGGTAEEQAISDAEWALVGAPGAQIVLVACSDGTANVNGAEYAAEVVIDHPFLTMNGKLVSTPTPPLPDTPIDSLSVGIDKCEKNFNNGELTLWSNYMSQAALEGISVYVSSGNDGAEACDQALGNQWDFSHPTGVGANTSAISGLAVNGYASTAYNVAVGGTDFQNAATEVAWNDSCGNYLITGANCLTGLATPSRDTDTATGGGVSASVAKPNWQTGVANLPASGNRQLPDVSMFAGDGLWGKSLVYCDLGGNDGTICDGVSAFNYGGGTSFPSATLAGVQAVINQATGSLQGNPNYVFYSLAAQGYGSTFNDITAGDTSVPCFQFLNVFPNCYTNAIFAIGWGETSTSTGSLQRAYNAGTFWDYTTGIGSLNIQSLVTNWTSAGVTTTTTVSANPTTIFSTGSTTLTATVKGIRNPATSVLDPSGTVTFRLGSTSGTVLGTGTLTPSATPGSSAATLVLSGGAPLVTGSDTIYAVFPGGDPIGDGGSSGSTTITVKGFPTTTTSISANPTTITGSTAPQQTVLTAVVTPSGPNGANDLAGQVTFTINGTAIAVSGNPANLPGTTQTAQSVSLTVPVTALQAGANVICATYGGSTYYGGSTSNPCVTVTVSEVVTTVPYHDFGAVTLGSTGQAYGFKVTNGTSSTVPLTFTFNNDPARDFTVNNACKSTLAPGAFCEIIFNYAPAANSTPQYEQANFVINVGPSQPAITVTLKGHSIAANGVVLTTLSYDFGSVGTGSSGSYTLTVQNTNNFNLHNLTFSGVGAPFSINTTDPNACANTNMIAHQTCTFTLVFSPTTAGQFTDNVSVSALDPSNNPVTFNPGNTTGATIKYTGTGYTSTSGLTASTGGHNWGGVTTGTTSSAYGTTLTNGTSGTLTLTLGPLGDTTHFHVTPTSNCGATLAAGAHCNLAFTFSPTAAGFISTTYPVSAKNSGGTSVTVTTGGTTITGIGLKGTGANNTLAISVNPVAFGAKPKNFSGIMTSNLTNQTAGSLNLTYGTLTAPFSIVVSTTCGATLASGASCTLEIQYAVPQGAASGTKYSEVYSISTSVPVQYNGTTVPGVTLTGSVQ